MSSRKTLAFLEGWGGHAFVSIEIGSFKYKYSVRFSPKATCFVFSWPIFGDGQPSGYGESFSARIFVRKVLFMVGIHSALLGNNATVSGSLPGSNC